MLCFLIVLGLSVAVESSERLSPEVIRTTAVRVSAEQHPDPTAGRLVDLRRNEPLDLAAFAEQLGSVDVVVLGEEHDNDAGHLMQASIIEALINAGRNVSISLEMFERDVQAALEDYVAGRIEEQEFLAAARPWPNYNPHYRPIIELAKQHRLPVIAANVPRPLARAVSRGEAINPTQQHLLPRVTTAPRNHYWHLFQQAMQSHMGADSGDAIYRMYQAQCLKDDAMAESISDHLDLVKHRDVVVVHLCGKFHSDFGLGTVERLLARQPLARVAVVTMQSTDEFENFDASTLRDRAHYAKIVPRNRPQAAQTEAEAASVDPTDGADATGDEAEQESDANPD